MVLILNVLLESMLWGLAASLALSGNVETVSENLWSL